MHVSIFHHRITPALFVALWGIASSSLAAEIYVLDARIEREGVSTVSPTFIVTPGERALLSFDGERDLDVAMTITPREDLSESSDELDLKVELIEGVQLDTTTVPVSLARTETLELAGRTIEVLIRVQEPLGQTTSGQSADGQTSIPAATPAMEAPTTATPAGDTNGS